MYKIKYSTFSELMTPYKDDEHKIYDLFVNVKDLPKGLPTKVNPRKVRTTTHVYKAITRGLIDDDHSFYLDNRGMFITAHDVKFKNHYIYLNLDDTKKYGLVDGGHTYHSILSNRSRIARDKNVFVHIEIVTGVSNIIRLAKDRNTNVQVQEKAIANLAGKFNPIKHVLKGTYIDNKVSYTQNDSKKYKPIDVLTIIKLLYALTFKSKTGEQPRKACNSSKGVLIDYLDNFSKYKNAIKHIPEVLQLYDFIEAHIRSSYKKIKLHNQLAAYQGFYHYSKFMRTKFYNYKTHDLTSVQIMIPIISGLRSIFQYHHDRYYWSVDPFGVMTKALPKIVNYVVGEDRQKIDTSARLGRDKNIYVYSYQQCLIAAGGLYK